MRKQEKLLLQATYLSGLASGPPGSAAGHRLECVECSDALVAGYNGLWELIKPAQWQKVRFSSLILLEMGSRARDINLRSAWHPSNSRKFFQPKPWRVQTYLHRFSGSPPLAICGVALRVFIYDRFSNLPWRVFIWVWIAQIIISTGIFISLINQIKLSTKSPDTIQYRLMGL